MWHTTNEVLCCFGWMTPGDGHAVDDVDRSSLALVRCFAVGLWHPNTRAFHTAMTPSLLRIRTRVSKFIPLLLLSLIFRWWDDSDGIPSGYTHHVPSMETTKQKNKKPGPSWGRKRNGCGDVIRPRSFPPADSHFSQTVTPYVNTNWIYTAGASRGTRFVGI